VRDDLGAGRPMDRLICGDVGFGKTEVALRAAFAVAMNGKQVAVVVPTTLLARQHYKNFTERFKGFPVNVGRPRGWSRRRRTEGDQEGPCRTARDIVVGTHALLGKAIKFKDLGLVIVDEEQHFGVKHKERLKELRADVHVLTLSATPIPRTLQLALDRRARSVDHRHGAGRPLAVRTFVSPLRSADDPRGAAARALIAAGRRSMSCRASTISPTSRTSWTSIVPEMKVAVAHGQMAPGSSRTS
jgi:transcription-repair coupling factor (superfamily II helicase)